MQTENTNNRLKLAVLMTVHNRKETTLECLKCLNACRPDFVALKVFLVDDGSTDGTSDAVISLYPSTIVIEGDGQLYWNRGMWVAWKESLKYDFDFFMWLNDDTMLNKDALNILFTDYYNVENDSIIVGEICSSNDNNTIVTYGGYNDRLLSPIGFVQPVKVMNGNVVLIPRIVSEKVGIIDPKFRHSFGDREYCNRTINRGCHAYCSSFFVGTCDRHEKVKKCYDSSCSICERVKFFLSPLGNPPSEIFYLYSKEKGIGFAFKAVMGNVFAVLFPKMAGKLKMISK